MKQKPEQLNGLKQDGTFSIIALEGPFADQPLMATIDVPIARDITQVAERLLARLTGRPVARTIGTGHSAGALVMQFVNSGASTNLDDGTRLFTGGNFVPPIRPYVRSDLRWRHPHRWRLGPPAPAVPYGRPHDDESNQARAASIERTKRIMECVVCS